MRRFFLILLLFCYFFSFSEEILTISEIVISGNKVTKEEIIMRELEFEKSDNLSISDLNEKIKKSKYNLINLKIFNFVEINHSKIDNEIKINIDVVEQWYIWPYPIFEFSERNFNTWWKEFSKSKFSDFSRLNYGVFLNWNNFRGRNEILLLKFRKGFKEHYLLSYQLPYFNKQQNIGINTNLQLFRRKKSFYKTEKNRLVYYEDENNFTTRDYEIHTELLYRNKLNKSHKIKFHYFETIADSIIVAENSNYLRSNTTNGSYSKISYEYTNENRDYIEYPLTGNYFQISTSKYIAGLSPAKNFEILGHIEKHGEISKNLFVGSSFKGKWSSNSYQPYFMQVALGFDDYVRGYEYYVVDGQDYWLSKNAIKYAIVPKKTFEIPYLKMDQFNKSHYSLFLGFFSDLGYVIDKQTNLQNPLANTVLWSSGVSLDYVTYYDKLLRIEFSINHLGEKGVFLHFSNPFGTKKEL